MYRIGLVLLLNSVALGATTTLPCHMCQFMMTTLEMNHDVIRNNVCHYFDNESYKYCGEVFQFLNFFMNNRTNNSQVCQDLTWCKKEDMYKVKFKKFVYQYGKVYENFKKFEEREEIYFNNIIYIEESNRVKSFKVGMNQFGDMTNEEFSTKKGIIYNQTSSCNGCMYYNKNGILNKTVDWVEEGAVTPVKNQGQCGSCWSFSTTGAVEGLHQIKTGELVSLSEQDLVDCASSYGNQGCNGGLMDDSFQYIIDNGLCTEAKYSYTGVSGSCRSCDRKKYITGCSDIKPNSEEDLMWAVLRQPVSIAIEADKMSFQFYKSGVYSDTNCGTNIDHGVLLVGYGEEDGKPYWKVKNSWGETWGDGGYIKILKGTGICGVMMQPSIPV
jgi:C1A family cysteine protease